MGPAGVLLEGFLEGKDFQSGLKIMGTSKMANESISSQGKGQKRALLSVCWLPCRTGVSPFAYSWEGLMHLIF